MLIAALEINNFRNLKHISLSCSSGLNLIVGANASGKTNLLEAVYYLGRARSFRTRQVRELIHYDAASCRIVATMADAVSGKRIPVGLERSPRAVVARIDGAPVRSLAQLAVEVPVLLLTPDSHRLLSDGPKQRRRFMDWGVFHANGAFHGAWKRYRNALRHRNAALRSNLPDRAVDAWNQELNSAAGTLDPLRDVFCEALEIVLKPFIQETLGEVAPQVEYRRGWPQGTNLIDVLLHGREQDRQQGYTRLGPHRADFTVRIAGRTASEHLSRGQQKLLIIALMLAQAKLYRTQRDGPCILLIDDLPAELDRGHRDRVMKCLANVEAQLFVTAIEADSLDMTPWKECRAFGIDRGEVVDKVI